MKFEGIIKHGVAIDAEESNSVNCEIIHCEGITLHLVDISSDNISITFGPIGPFINMNNYYTKTEIDNKGYLTQHLDISQLATKLLLEDYQPKGEYLVLSDIEGKADIDDVYTKEYIDNTKLDVSHIKFRLKALPSYASNVYTIENTIFSVIGYNIDAAILEDALGRSSSKGGWVDVAILPSSFKKLDNLISAINAEIGDNGFQYKSPIPSTTNSVYSGINSSLIDNGSNINKIVENLEGYIIDNATKVSNLVDLTNVFSTGIANDINLAIASNRKKVIYVSPGDYEVDGSINFHGAELVLCFGNIIGPEDPSVLKNKYYSADAGDGKSPIIRYVVSANGNGNKLYIKKITVRGNYCGFYIFFETNADIKIGEIIGLYGVIDGVDYSAKTEEWVSYVNKAPLFNAKKKTRQAVLPDDWVINAGFMFEHIENSTINIGGISNLNYGFYSIRNYISLFDQVLRECVFNINSIVCKKAVVLDNANILSLQNGEIVKNYRTNDYSYFAVVNDRDIEGNVFNIGGLDYVEAPNTNSVEIMNEDYYDQTKDNRRIVFWLLDRYRTRDGIPEREINDNKFTGAYLQGVYDVMIDAVNIGATIWDLHFQLVDLYYNDGTLCSGRTNAYNHQHKISYYKGNPSNSQELYLAIQVFDADPIFVLDNCYTMYIHNYGDAFIRPADIDVKSNCRDIRFNLVYDDNFLSGWQIIDRVNYAYMKDYIYDRGNIYKRSWNDGYTNSSNEGVNYYTRSEIDNKGYLTQHQSLSNYYTKTEVDTALGDKANSADLASVATSGSYNDLNNKPMIPTVPINVSAFNNDAGYLTQHQSLANYYTKTEIDATKANKVQEVEVSGATPTQELAPNTMYKFTGAVTALTLTLGTAISGITNMYAFSFTAGAANPAITWPQGCKLDGEPTIGAGDYFEATIQDGYVLYKIWKSSTT